MVTCEVAGTMATIGDFMVWPTTCNYYFYMPILLAIMAILAWVLYSSEEDKIGVSNFISALGTSAIATIVLTVIGTLIQNSDGIPMIQRDILLIILAIGIPIILIWIFSSKDE